MLALMFHCDERDVYVCANYTVSLWVSFGNDGVAGAKKEQVQHVSPARAFSLRFYGGRKAA